MNYDDQRSPSLLLLITFSRIAGKVRSLINNCGKQSRCITIFLFNCPSFFKLPDIFLIACIFLIAREPCIIAACLYYFFFIIRNNSPDFCLPHPSASWRKRKVFTFSRRGRDIIYNNRCALYVQTTQFYCVGKQSKVQSRSRSVPAKMWVSGRAKSGIFTTWEVGDFWRTFESLLGPKSDDSTPCTRAQLLWLSLFNVHVPPIPALLTLVLPN